MKMSQGDFFYQSISVILCLCQCDPFGLKLKAFKKEDQLHTYE